MKKINALWMALALGASASTLLAQDAGAPPRRPGGPPPHEQSPDGAPPEGAARERGPGRDGERPRMIPPLIAALDANSDGVIDADEIAQAAASLAKLDKNGDGQITVDEMRPARPAGGPRGAEGDQRPPRDGNFDPDRPAAPTPDGQGHPDQPRPRRRPSAE